MKFTYKTTAELEGMTPEQLDAYKTDMRSYEGEMQNKAISDAVRAEMQKGNEALKDFLSAEIGKQLLEKMPLGIVNETFKTNLRSFVKSKHNEIVKAVKEGKQFEIKVATPHLTSNTVDGLGVGDITSENVVMMPGVDEIQYPANFVLNVFPNTVMQDVPSHVTRLEQTPKEGAFAIVSEGGLKPLLQYKFAKTITQRQKVAGRLQWSEEFEKDYTMLFSSILRIFEQDLVRDFENKILTEIMTNATPYVSGALAGTLVNPDNGLAIVAGQSQVKSLNDIPDLVLINPEDLTATLYQQDANGNLKIHPYIDIAKGTIAGMRYVERNLIPQGTAYVGYSGAYQIYHENPTLKIGLDSDDFSKNKKTAIAETYFVATISELRLTSWVELDLEVVKADLQKP